MPEIIFQKKIQIGLNKSPIWHICSQGVNRRISAIK